MMRNNFYIGLYVELVGVTGEAGAQVPLCHFKCICDLIQEKLFKNGCLFKGLRPLKQAICYEVKTA